MIAYLGDESLKRFLINELKEHQRLDHIVKGVYWADGRGCAVGCTLEAVAKRNGKWAQGIDHADHALYESELGIPKELAYLQDAIFEGLPEPEHQSWPLQFAEAIKTGADLSGVWPEFAIALLSDPTGPVWPQVQDPKWAQQLAAIQGVAAFYQNQYDSDAAWAAARAAARAAGAAVAAAYRWERDLLLKILQRRRK